MQINVRMDLSTLDATAKRYQKNLAYSTAQALNAAALEAQKRIRESLRVHFHLRKTDFMMRSIKIFAFAKVSQQRAYAELGIDNKARLILSLFETGGQRLPFKGRSVAVPITGQIARPGIGASVNEAYTFQALNFRRGPITQAGRKQRALLRTLGVKKQRLGRSYYVWQGNNRTFILPHTARAPYGGVFQRVGPKRDDIRLIYSFRRNVQLRKALDFIQTSRQAYEDVFRDTFYTKFYRLGQP